MEAGSPFDVEHLEQEPVIKSVRDDQAWPGRSGRDWRSFRGSICTALAHESQFMKTVWETRYPEVQTPVWKEHNVLCAEPERELDA